MKVLDILIDFDGTCTEHAFPAVGPSVPGAVAVLKELSTKGHRLILFTMRSNRITFKKIGDGLTPDTEGRFLNDAIKWFMNNKIPLYGVQSNPDQSTWTESPKAYGHMMIDDSALGCPLIHNLDGSRPYVDWLTVRKLLIQKGAL